MSLTQTVAPLVLSLARKLAAKNNMPIFLQTVLLMSSKHSSKTTTYQNLALNQKFPSQVTFTLLRFQDLLQVHLQLKSVLWPKLPMQHSLWHFQKMLNSPDFPFLVVTSWLVTTRMEQIMKQKTSHMRPWLLMLKQLSSQPVHGSETTSQSREWVKTANLMKT